MGVSHKATILYLDATNRLTGRWDVKEKALLRHRKKPGHGKGHRDTGEGDDIQAEEGPARHGEEDLPKDRTHCEAHQGGTSTVTRDFLVHAQVNHTVDIRVVGNFSSGGDAIEELQELNGQQSLGIEQHEPCDNKAEALQQHNRLVTEVVCGEEHGEQQHQVGVSPHWVNFIEDLVEAKYISISDQRSLIAYETIYQHLKQLTLNNQKTNSTTSDKLVSPPLPTPNHHLHLFQSQSIKA